MLKKVIGCGVILFSASAFAVSPGLYLGVKLGPASNSSGTQQAQVSPGVTTPVDARTNQFGSRLYMGYKINQYAGYEFGLNMFSKIKYDTKNVNTCSSPNVSVRDFDFTGKGSYSLTYADVYAKAGIAVVYQTVSGSLRPDSSTPCGQSEHQTNFRPTVSLGASYDLNQNWVLDASWDRLMAGGVAGNVDFYGLGISYHFVDVYCGQFLC